MDFMFSILITMFCPGIIHFKIQSINIFSFSPPMFSLPGVFLFFYQLTTRRLFILLTVYFYQNQLFTCYKFSFSLYLFYKIFTERRINMADNNNILNEAETASENDNLDNNLTNEDYNGTTDNKESQYVPDIDVFSTDKVNSYVKLSDKYEDIKSSAATMLIVGGVGLVLMALIIAKVIVLPISAETSWLFYSVMGGVFIIFVIAGIVSFMHAKQVKIEAAEEDKLIDSINTWANDNLKISDLDQGLDLSQPDEILFFSRAERIKKALMMEFENADEPLIDELTEQIFHTLYEE